MMQLFKLTAAALLTVTATLTTAQAGTHAEGMITLKSPNSVQQTTDKLVAALNSKGMTVFKRVDHTAGAAKAGLALPPTQLVIFGNPKVGTPLMQCAPTVAIDLPQKALIWQDKAGQVWYSYNDPDYLKRRHNITGCDAVLGKVKKALAAFANAATSTN